MKRMIILSALLIPAITSAQCWVVTNLKGYGAMQPDGYVYGKDGITNGVFHVIIEKEKAGLKSVGSSLVGSGLAYVPMGGNTMIGIYRDGEKTTVETWAITKDNKALYTKVINSNYIFSSSKSMIGDVVGACSTKP
ncbi:hypothetical protein C3374_22210 [Pantoea sp. PSNIH4]|nr:hypothetical protein C3380_19510 [Pantoea sp. PSNIH5]POU60039.1 hypothetical protein C3374_22210 [Pantoea sp. PSNIH4]POY65979.1 hypothetical protein C3402_20325 [Pantoea sp. PSNIH3]